MFPNAVEPTAQAMMGGLKRFWNRANPVYSAATTGSDVYTVSFAAALTGYGLYERTRLRFQRANNSTSTSLIFSALPGQPVRKYDGAGNLVNLRVGDIQPQDHGVWWDGSEFILENPARAAAGGIAQMVWSETGLVASGTTVIPLDNTKPQSTEGDQYLTQAITPLNAASTLEINVVAAAGVNQSGAWIIGALFQDSAPDALAAMMALQATANGGVNLAFRHFMPAGTTASTTFALRLGPGSSTPGTLTFNGSNGSQFLGQSFASSLSITEHLP